MECPECGRKVAIRSDECIYCGYAFSGEAKSFVDEPLPEWHEKPARQRRPLSLEARLERQRDPEIIPDTTPDHKVEFNIERTEEKINLSTWVIIGLSGLILLVIFYFFSALTGQGLILGGGKELSEEARALKDLSLVQAAMRLCNKDFGHYANFIELKSAGYLKELDFDYIDVTRIETESALITLDSKASYSTFFITARTKNGSDVWRIDQESPDVLEAYGID